MTDPLQAEIQRLRQMLHSVVEMAKDDLLAEEVLSVSRQLDKLLLAYELKKYGNAEEE